MVLNRLLLFILAFAASAPSFAGEGEACPVVHIVPERLPDLNIPREGHAMFFAGGELTVAGGHTHGFVPTPTAEYLKDGEWHQLSMTYTHDHGTALVMRSGLVLLAGGSKEEMGVGQTFGVEMYNPVTHTFNGFGCLDQKRTLASAMELDSSRVLITGNWYAKDDMEIFDGRKFFHSVKPVSVGRAVPYLFRTSLGDILIVSDRDTYDNYADTIIVDRLYGKPYTVPLLQHWKPLTYIAPTTVNAGFIGDEMQGHMAYLMAVRNFERTTDKPELKGLPAGQVAVALVEDTVFTLLPTVCPIPMVSPLGAGPIFYDRSYILADRQAQRAYLCGVDKDKRLYVVSISYAQRPAPLMLYYTDPLPECGFYVPVLTPQGNMAIVGGSTKINYDSDNFAPTASAWLVPLGRPDDVTTADSGWLRCMLWWILPLVAVLLVLVVFIIIHKRKPSADDVDSLVDSGEQSGEDPTESNKNEEMMSLICQLMDNQKVFRDSGLRTADVAAELGTNSRYVADCIKVCRNMTFTQFVNEYRINYAQQLLRQDPDRKIVEVCYDAGFASERSFFRIFKEATGMTTSEWLSQQKD